jgi:hypothetical protein
MAIIKNQTQASFGKDGKKSDPCTLLVGKKTV